MELHPGRQWTKLGDFVTGHLLFELLANAAQLNDWSLRSNVDAPTLPALPPRVSQLFLTESSLFNTF
ncbi:hypothetical protein H9L39_03259 [Fusarium oxysporum f. sp. albedinis]|nr:hypothetical protein H9L39_03259 [Fusarium oxysporum f. sp. albedinis]